MKLTTHFLPLLAATAFILVSCDDKSIQNVICDNVNVSIKNDTGTDIHNFTFNGENLGLLNDGEEIKNICLNEITLDTGYPLIYFSGEMQGDEIKSIASAYWCGVGITTSSEGIFKIELKERSEWDDTFVLYESIEE